MKTSDSKIASMGHCILLSVHCNAPLKVHQLNNARQRLHKIKKRRLFLLFLKIKYKIKITQLK